MLSTLISNTTKYHQQFIRKKRHCHPHNLGGDYPDVDVDVDVDVYLDVDLDVDLDAVDIGEGLFVVTVPSS